MKKRILSIVLLVAMAVSLLSGCGGNNYEVELPTELVENAEIFVNPVEGISDDFIKGMDISSILSLEDSGVKFYNEAGEEQDIFKTLADAGINYIRVRVWNDPYDADGNGYGGGNCDAKVAAEIGKRAAKYGMKLLVDFHYSDFWADPAKQMAPKAWADMDFFGMQEAIVEYTKDSLKTIQDAGAEIGMVQIGNEINHGMAGLKNYTQVLGLLKSAAEAVKSVSEDILVCVHYTEIDNAEDIMKKAANLESAEVDYDVFGVSY
ncbi:MAG: glycosyl hydrolase 53 family protein, partial [Agathobacter sp.]|nr:glycosyl hydrolase 53 family protein [Agathobacter sp.]